MSRTYRRKNGWNAPTYDYCLTEEGYFEKQYYDKSSKKYKLEKNKYHRDKDIYGGGVPHWYVNLNCERQLRRKTKRELHKWVKNPDSEAMVPLFMRDAGYSYW